MDQFEESVLGYLCGPSERFVSPQFNIPYEGVAGGSCPDFVVVDFSDRTIYVVEVTQAADTNRVMQRVMEREKRWFGPLRDHFRNLDHLFASWDLHVTLFVRQEEAETARLATVEFPDVSVMSLESVVFSWRWDWKHGRNGRPSNPLRDPAKARRAATS